MEPEKRPSGKNPQKRTRVGTRAQAVSERAADETSTKTRREPRAPNHKAYHYKCMGTFRARRQIRDCKYRVQTHGPVRVVCIKSHTPDTSLKPELLRARRRTCMDSTPVCWRDAVRVDSIRLPVEVSHTISCPSAAALKTRVSLSCVSTSPTTQQLQQHNRLGGGFPDPGKIKDNNYYSRLAGC